MFKKILIANRGEIAQRLIVACHELGITAVCVYAQPDAGAAWYAQADEAYLLPGEKASQTYLNQDAILAIAQQCGAEAIHPGYGFLSENASFAIACAEKGLKFIGPTPSAIEKMGSKAESRRVAEAAGVPTVPGVDIAGKELSQLGPLAADIGYPLLVKASAGGGGKGMRIVQAADELADAVQAARSEAESSFGDGRLLLEKYFTTIHHVEVQILADQHGNVRHLFERECSIQRRHQKIIEESPAPVIRDSTTREAICQAAVSLAEAVGYQNAGTVEFIMDENGRFYFLEMNTRLQVEHPITELVTGVDLAVWQIRIANNEPLTFPQAEVAQRGHAIECRIYAEDPANHFLPSIGQIGVYARPHGPGIRVDDGISSGTAVTPYYDPMLAKLVTWGRTRTEAIDKMLGALREMVVLGVTTNIPFLLDILEEADFRAGRTTTRYLETHLMNWQPNEEMDEAAWIETAVFEALHNSQAPLPTSPTEQPTSFSPWQQSSQWRNVAKK